MCLCFCGVCGMCFMLCLCLFYFVNIYLHLFPLLVNTEISSVHAIQSLSFWSIFATTCGDLFRTMTNYHSI